MSKTMAGTNSWARARPAPTDSMASTRAAAIFREGVMVCAPVSPDPHLGTDGPGAPIIAMCPGRDHRAGSRWRERGDSGYSRGPMGARPRIYMAGPLGFSEAGRHFYSTVLIPFVKGLGYDVLDPWALTDPGAMAAVENMPCGPERREAWRELNREIGAANRRAIDAADGVVAILDGPDVDSGTAAEIGYAFA